MEELVEQLNAFVELFGQKETNYEQAFVVFKLEIFKDDLTNSNLYIAVFTKY